MIYRLKYLLALNGRTLGDGFSVSTHIRTNLDPTDAKFDTGAENSAKEIAKLLHKRIRIVRATFSPIPTKDYANILRGNHIPVTLDIQGERGNLTTEGIAAKLMVARYAKLAKPGNPGGFNIRGCYVEAEMQATDAADLEGVLDATETTLFKGFGDKFKTALSAQNMTLVMEPDAGWIKKNDEDAREVTKLVYLGAGTRQTTAPRSSVEAAQKALARRKVNEIGRQLDQAQGESEGGIVGTDDEKLIVDAIFEVMRQFGTTLILKIIGNDELRTYAVKATKLSGTGQYAKLPQ